MDFSHRFDLTAKSRPTKDTSGSLHMQYLIELYIKPSEKHLTHVQSQEEKLGKNINIDRHTNVSVNKFLIFRKKSDSII